MSCDKEEACDTVTSDLGQRCPKTGTASQTGRRVLDKLSRLPGLNFIKLVFSSRVMWKRGEGGTVVILTKISETIQNQDVMGSYAHRS
jgi:hypothetical protein